MTQHYFVARGEYIDGKIHWEIDADAADFLPGTVYDPEIQEWVKPRNVDDDSSDYLLSLDLKRRLRSDLTDS